MSKYECWLNCDNGKDNIKHIDTNAGALFAARVAAEIIDNENDYIIFNDDPEEFYGQSVVVDTEEAVSVYRIKRYGGLIEGRFVYQAELRSASSKNGKYL